MSETKILCGGCGRKFIWRGIVPPNAVCWPCFERNKRELAGE